MELGVPKSAREWCYLIAVVVLLEFIFLHSVYTYGTDKEVLAYSTFAGTITSIILALIAIIWGFVQTITQQNSAVELGKQIDSLKNVGKDVTGSASTLTEGLTHLSSLARKLEDIGQVVTASQRGITDVSGKLGEMIKAQDKIRPIIDTPDTTPAIEAKTLVEWITAANVATTNVVYCLYKLDGKKLDRPGFAKILRQANQAGLSDADKELDLTMYFRGHLAGTIGFLRAMGLLQVDDTTDILQLSPILKKALAKYFATEDPGKLNYPTDALAGFNHLKNYFISGAVAN